VAVVSTPSRAEWLSRERDDREREEFRLRKLRTRPELLAEVDAMVADGSLIVRQATEDERLRFGIKPAAEEPRKTAAELAREAGVSVRTMERTLRVKEADPELFQKLAEGKVSATTADECVKLGIRQAEETGA
jgi:hypothetical protein